MQTTHCIYRHIRPDTNEVFYVGQGKEGTGRALDKRRNDMWEKIVRKNEGNYRIEVMLDGLTQEEANQKESEFIALYGFKKDGTGTLANLINGGKGVYEYKMSADKKEALSKRSMGNTYNLGRKHTEESRKKMSLSHIGRPATKGNSGKVSVNRGKKWPEEVKAKMSLGHMGNPSHKGKIAITNGVDQTYILKEAIDFIPEGWWKGTKKRKEYAKESGPRRNKGKSLNETFEQKEHRRLIAKGNIACTGMVWVTNGTDSKLINKNDIIQEGWRRGRHHKTNPNGYNKNKKKQL